jgi:hypothetical protein
LNQQIQAALEVVIIARRLKIGRATASLLSNELSQRWERSITNQDILKVIHTLGRASANEAVLAEIEKDSKLILAIAKELDELPEDASLFADHLQQKYRWATYTDILQAITYLDSAERKVYAIQESLELVLIAKKLGIERSQVQAMADEITKTTGLAITNQMLVVHVWQMAPVKQHPITDQIFIACTVAQEKNMSLNAAANFTQTFLKQIQAPLSYQQFWQAFSAVNFSLSPADIKAQLVYESIEQQLQISLSELAIKVEEVVGSAIPLERIVEVVQALGSDATTEAVLARYKEEFASVIFIAQEMDIPSSDVRDALHRISQIYGSRVSDEDVIQILKRFDGWPKTISQVVDELFADQIVNVMNMPLPWAKGLAAKLTQITEQPVSNKKVVKTLKAMKEPLHNTESLLAMLLVTKTLGVGVETVLRLLDKIEEGIGKAFSITDFGRILSNIAVVHRNSDDIVSYVLIDQYLGESNEKSAAINDIVAQLKENKTAATRFWPLLKQYTADNQITERDLDYLFKIATWSAYPVQIMSPKIAEQEYWMTQDVLDSLLKETSPEGSLFQGRERRGQQNQREAQVKLLDNYSNQCWRIIRSDQRRYQVPSRGRAEIMSSERLKSLINLHSVRFVQEGVSAPGVFIQLVFSEPDAIGLLRLTRDSSIEGFHKLSENSWLQALIIAIALAYYRDLVIPGKIYYPKERNQSHNRKGSPVSSHSPTRRQIPSRQTIKRHSKKLYPLEDWYESQEILRHWVRGHTRWIGPHFEASAEKYRQAELAGVRLRAGETWVIEHERGNPQDQMKVKLDGEDLVEHTYFAPPIHASEELDQILF